jgi:hypothetical protein
MNTASKSCASSAQARNRRVQAQFSAHRHDVADLLVEHLARQSERGDVVAHQSAGDRLAFENDTFVTQWQQIVRNRQRRWPGPDQRDALAVARRRCAWQVLLDRLAMVGRDAFQPTDCDRLVVDAAAPAGRLTRSIADPAENAGEYVRLAIQQVRVGMAALRDQPDVLGHVGMCGAGPLAVDDAVKPAGIGRVGRLHRSH